MLQSAAVHTMGFEKIKIESEFEEKRLNNFLADYDNLDLSRSYIKTLIKEGKFSLIIKKLKLLKK